MMETKGNGERKERSRKRRSQEGREGEENTVVNFWGGKKRAYGEKGREGRRKFRIHCIEWLF